MKKFAAIFIATIISLGATTTTQAVKEYEGDVLLACEANLCVPTNDDQPGCKKSLEKYFSIKELTDAATEEARQKFLDMCPEN